MNIWTEDNYAALGEAYRRAIEARAQAANTAPVDFLNTHGSGMSAVESYVEADRQAFRVALNAAADRLFDDGGFTSEQVAALVEGLIAASPQVRAQVTGLLLS